MTSKGVDCARRAIDSSAVVRFLRPAIAGSAGCTTQQLDAIASGSRVIGALSSLLTALYVARRDAGVTRLLSPIVNLDLVERVRLAGCIILVAVMTHTVLLAVLGVAAHAVGWTIRAGLVVGSVIVMRWPEPFAAAWRDRTAHRGARQR